MKRRAILAILLDISALDECLLANICWTNASRLIISVRKCDFVHRDPMSKTEKGAMGRKEEDGNTRLHRVLRLRRTDVDPP